MDSDISKENHSKQIFDDYELKISNKIIGCELEKNIKGTSKYNKDCKTNLIQDIRNDELKLHQRIFYKNEQKDVGYIEVFQNSFLSYAHELSEKISFLFNCDSKNNQRIDANKCFGFRYYDLNNNYCTLLKSNDENEDNYFFLEKLKKDDNEFYDGTLDCFKIIFDSIFSRYKIEKKGLNGNNFDFQLVLERPLHEILGFCYSVKEKSNDIFIFHKLHSIEILKDNDFTSHISKDNAHTKLNIMPILFDGHISLIFFFDEEDKRIFILSDPSHVHTRLKGNSIIINPFIFSENIRKNLIFYPDIKIQAFNSCSLWYYFQILCLINYDIKVQSIKYTNKKDFLKSIEDSLFYLDCFNYYQLIMGFDNKRLIEINPKELYNDEDYFYWEKKSKISKHNVKIHKYCFLNQFVDFMELIKLITNQDLQYKPGLYELNQFRENNEELIDFIIYLNHNINLLELNSQRDQNIVEDLKNEVNTLNDLRNNYIHFCIIFLSGLAQFDKENKYLERFNSKILEKYQIHGSYIEEIYAEIKGSLKDFAKRKNNIENKYDLYPLNITGKALFPIVGFLYKSK